MSISSFFPWGKTTNLSLDSIYLPVPFLLTENSLMEKAGQRNTQTEYRCLGIMLAPTQGDGYMKLKCIREVFGVKKTSEKK